MRYKNGYLKRMDVFKNSSHQDHLSCLQAYSNNLKFLLSSLKKLYFWAGKVFNFRRLGEKQRVVSTYNWPISKTGNSYAWELSSVTHFSDYSFF